MENWSSKKKNLFLMVSVAVSMLFIIMLWLFVFPPEYFKEGKNDGVFDTLKTEFSNL